MIKTNEKSSYRILVIDDNTAIHEDFRKILTKEENVDDSLVDMETLLFGSESGDEESTVFEVDSAFQGEQGLQMVEEALAEGRPYSLAFVDVRMPPGWDGIETISRLWKVAPDLQVVLCTAYADYSWKDIHKILGTNENMLILKKPFDNVEVLQLAHALCLKWKLSREIAGRLNRLAYYDHLTGLPNRTLFLDRLTQTIRNAERYQHKGALLFIDLDNFKRINDTLGHYIGDELLKVVGERLVASLRFSDTVSRPAPEETAARLGGDEFTVILPKLEKEDEAGTVARRILRYLEKPIILDKHEFIVTGSIGIAIIPEDGSNVEQLLKNADLAMYFAKSSGQGGVKYFQESMNDTALKKLTIENQLRLAIDRGELSLNYQPQVELGTGRLVALEALLRWNSKDLGNVPPTEFIPVAEESGLIIPIGEWVLGCACKQAQRWVSKGLSFRRIAVNVSVKQFTHPHFVEMVTGILQETKLEAHRLEIEITESLLGHDQKEVAEILKKLRAKNVGVAVDDFGKGYSCLSRLKDLPINCLKIDRSFIRGIETGNDDRSIIGAIMGMAEGMGLRVIAEGVERDQQMEFLLNQNCREAQGYLFSRPLNTKDTEKFLEDCMEDGCRKIDLSNYAC